MSRKLRNFLILFFGMLLIFGIATYMLYNMQKVNRHQIALERKAHVLQRIQKMLYHKGRIRAVMAMQRPGLRISRHTSPLSNSQQITAPIKPTLVDWIRSHPKVNTYSIAYTPRHNPTKQVWAIIQFKPDILSHAYLRLDFWVLVALAIFYILLCIWVVYDFNKPLKQLKKLSSTLSQGNYPLQVLAIESNEITPITESINRLSARITQLLNDRTQMLAAISHDLKTPITRLRLRAESLSGEQQTKVLNDLDEMEQMIKGVLEFVQSESDEASSHFDIIALLDTLCIERQDMGQDAVFKTNCDRLTYQGQMHALRRAMANIIDNAIKYGESARVAVTKTGTKLLIKISDTGPGIPENEQARVFQPFYRVESSRNKSTGGTGLGLVIAKNIIQQHQGTISLSNILNGGLCVTIELPLS